jgi:hypothetical protein
MSKDNFEFPVSYICTRCCDCPDFDAGYEEGAYCRNMLANGFISEHLDNDYYSTIHKKCPRRKG